MTKGTVVYIANAASLPPDFDDEQALRSLALAPESAVVAAEHTGFYDLMQATHVLLARGAKRAEAIRVRSDANGRLERLGEPMRLFG